MSSAYNKKAIHVLWGENENSKENKKSSNLYV